MRLWIQEEMNHTDILEVACGTGYWTQRLAQVASSITALDASSEVLEIARQKEYPLNRVHFLQADAFRLDDVAGHFGAVFAGFWFSHVRRQEQESFLRSLHRKLRANGKVVMIDNRYVKGSSTPIARSDADGNTYQIRTLADGSHHEVLKNFPTAVELRSLLGALSSDHTIKEFDYYWGVSYVVGEPV